MTEIVLYGHPDSGHACKVALALSLAQIPHRTVFVDIWAERATRPTDFLAVSPLGEVPVLVIDGTPYFQSGAILMQIAERFGVLGGESAEGTARGRSLLMWEANRIGMCLPQLKQAHVDQFVGWDPAVIKWLEGRYAVDAANFDVLIGDAPFLHGDAPGFGDVQVWGYVQWVREAGQEPTEKMQAWMDRMLALPAMRTPAEFFPA